MGEIFLARQIGVAGFDRLVILKSVLPAHAADPDAVDQFLNEARIMGCISHPNVVAVYEVGEWEGAYFMAMEYIAGVDLNEIVVAQGGVALTPRFVATVGRDAAQGLDFAHHALDSNGNPLQVVHRDVTPHNIMVRRDGVVKLVDFGVARTSNRRKKTETGVLKGKLGYFSPEQVEGDDVDGRSDQYVLGVVLWELLTGQRAYPGENTALILKKIATQRLPRASTLALVAPELDAIVYRMTTLDPGERYPRLSEAALALRAFVHTTTGDETELAATVQRLFGAQLDERGRDPGHEVEQLEGRTLTFRAVKEGDGAQARELPAPPPSARRSREAVIDLEHADESPVALAPGHRARDSFREIELDLGPEAHAPLEVGRTGRFSSSESGSRPDDVELDLPMTPVEEPTRDEITVVCALLVAPAEARGRLANALRDGATSVGATFAVVNENAIICSFGGDRADNRSPERGVRLATELLGTIDDASGALGARVTARIGVATGLSPTRDSRGSCTPSLNDAAVDRARRLAAVAGEGRVMVAQHTQRFTGRRVKYTNHFVTLIDQWNGPFVASEIAGYGAPPAATELLDRDVVREELRRVVESGARRRAAGMVLVGDAGAGKTASLGDVERLARWKGLVVARANCGRVVATAPYDVIRQLVRSAAIDVSARLADDVDVAEERPWVDGLQFLDLGSADRRRLQIFLGERDGEPDVPSGRRRALMRGALLTFFRALADQVGVCFLLDDLHRIDAGSLEVIGTVLAHLADKRVAVVATARPGLSERTFPRLPRRLLPPLGPDAIVELAQRAAFDTGLPPQITQLVRERSAGNPLHAGLLTRWIIAARVVERVANGWVLRADLQKLALPPSLFDVAHALAGLLSPTARTFLRLASRVGAEIADGLFSRELGAEQCASAANEALDVDLLVPAGSGAAVRFPSSALREAMAVLPPDKGPAPRNANHVIAEALESIRLDDAALAADMRTHHSLVADLKERVVTSSAVSAAYHAACGHIHVASEAYQRAVVAHYKALARTAPDDEAIARVLALAATTVEVMAEIDPVAAADFFMPLLKELPRASAPLARARLQRQRGLVYLRLGRLVDAERAFDDALDLCPPESNGEAPHILSGLAHVFEAKNDLKAAIVQLRQVFHIMADHDVADRTFRWRQWLALGRLQTAVPLLAETRASLARALEEATLAKSAWGVAEVTAAIARVTILEGNPAEGGALLDQAAEHWIAWGDREAAARCLQSAARIVAPADPAGGTTRLARALDNARIGEWGDGVVALQEALANDRR